MLKTQGIVYQIYSIQTGRIYIGSTISKFKTRKKRHFSDLRANRHHNNILQGVFNKYGENDLCIEIIDSVNVDMVREIEQLYIDYHRIHNNIMNLDFTVVKHAGDEYREKYLSKVLSNDFKEFCNLFSNRTENGYIKIDTLKLQRINIKQHLQNIFNGYWNRKIVLQVDIESKNVLNIFDSLTSAAKEAGVGENRIRRVCNKSRKSSGGYGWAYLEDSDDIKSRDFTNLRKPISVTKINSTTGQVISIYSSIKEAERENSFSDGSLRYYYRKGNNTEGVLFKGFNWRFGNV